MTNFFSTALAGLALTTLMACGGSATGGKTPIDEPVPDPEPVFAGAAPTITSADLRTRYDLHSDAVANRITGSLPFGGTASYRGHMAGSLTGDDVIGDSLHGTVNMRADLRGSGDSVTGSINNLHIARNGTPVEKLGGTISISGTSTDSTGRLSANLIGVGVNGQINSDDVQNLSVNGDMSGTFRDRPDGEIAGITTYDKASVITGNFDLTLTGDDGRLRSEGSYYVTE